MTLIRKRPIVVRPIADDDDCFLDDVHRVFRESHQSHGLSGSKLGGSFYMSADLTSTLADDDDKSLEDGKSSADPPAARRQARLTSSASGCTSSVISCQTTTRSRGARSIIDEDASSIHSAAPSVVRRSATLTRAAASAESARVKLENFLRSGVGVGQTHHAGGGDDACSLQSELNRLRNSERELDGLWAAASTSTSMTASDGDDVSSLGSWKMVGDDPSVASWRMVGDEASVLTEDYDEGSVMVGSIMGSVMLGSIMEEKHREEEEEEEVQSLDSERRSDPRISPDQVEGIGVQSECDDLSIISMELGNDTLEEDDNATYPESCDRFDATALAPSRSIDSPLPSLKRLSTLSPQSCSSEIIKEMTDLTEEGRETESLPVASPVGFVTFEPSYPPGRFLQDGTLDNERQTSRSLPTLKSYQESTEDGDEIFYSSVTMLDVDEESEDIICPCPDTPEAKGCSVEGDPPYLANGVDCADRSVSKEVVSARKWKCVQESSLAVLLRYAETMAEFLYGW